MRWTKFLISLLITAGLLVALLFPIAPATFPLGSFMDPFQGFWQNATAAQAEIPQKMDMPGLRNPAEVVVDMRDVPHIFTENLQDAAYVQG